MSPFKEDTFTIKIQVINERTGKVTLDFENRNNDCYQTIKMEEGLLNFFIGILNAQKAELGI